MGIYFNRPEQGTILYPLVLYFLTVLAYWERLISGVILSVVVPPCHRKFLSVTELVTCVEVEHSSPSSDYRSLMYTVNRHEITH